MSKGLGRIERAILEHIEKRAKPEHSDAVVDFYIRTGHPERLTEPCPVGIKSWTLCFNIYQPPNDWNYRPTLAQRKAVARAMRSFVRKKQQYALAGGNGSKDLILYDANDPVSVMWAKMMAAHKKGRVTKPDPCINDAKAAVAGRPPTRISHKLVRISNWHRAPRDQKRGAGGRFTK